MQPSTDDLRFSHYTLKILGQVYFSNEAYFHLLDYINAQNQQISGIDLLNTDKNFLKKKWNSDLPVTEK